MQIEIEKIESNPYRKLVANPVDKQSNRYIQLRKSILETTYWKNISVRKHPEKAEMFQLIYGHHRLEILKELGYVKADFIIDECSDIDMFRRMVLENKDYGKKSISDVMEVYLGFLEQIKSDYLKVNKDVTKMPDIIRLNYESNFELFNNYYGVLEDEIKKIFRNEKSSALGYKLVANIFGQVYADILKLIIEYDFDYQQYNEEKPSVVLETLKNKVRYSGNELNKDNLEDEARRVLNNHGIRSLNDANLPKFALESLIERVLNHRMTLDQFRKEIIKLEKLITEENEEISDLTKPGYMYVLEMKDENIKSYLKVGYTNRSAEVRRVEIDKGPFELEVIKEVHLPHAGIFERMINKKILKDYLYRENREWYKGDYLPIILKIFGEVEAKTKSEMK